MSHNIHELRPHEGIVRRTSRNPRGGGRRTGADVSCTIWCFRVQGFRLFRVLGFRVLRSDRMVQDPRHHGGASHGRADRLRPALAPSRREASGVGGAAAGPGEAPAAACPIAAAAAGARGPNPWSGRKGTNGVSTNRVTAKVHVF